MGEEDPFHPESSAYVEEFQARSAQSLPKGEMEGRKPVPDFGPLHLDKLKGTWCQFPHAKMAMSELSEAVATFGSTFSEGETTEVPSDTVEMETDTESDLDDEDFVVGNQLTF